VNLLKNEFFGRNRAEHDPAALGAKIDRDVLFHFRHYQLLVWRGHLAPLFPTAGKPVLSLPNGMPAGRKAGTASPHSGPEEMIIYPRPASVANRKCDVAILQKLPGKFLQNQAPLHYN
jgi:hypothetical protein